MLYIFDTETNGLPRYFYPKFSNYTDWPRLVSIAYKRECEGCNDPVIEHVIRPDNFKISAESTAIHGITQERALKEGISTAEAIVKLVDILRADEDPTLCAYNVTFDKGILISECHRHNLETELQFLTGPTVQWVCLMKQAHLVLQRGNKKYLKLHECVKSIMAATDSNSDQTYQYHSAAGDVCAASCVLQGIIAIQTS